MSKVLIMLILSHCPGWDTNHLGQTVTTDCQEAIVNCAIVGDKPATADTINTCAKKIKGQ